MPKDLYVIGLIYKPTGVTLYDEDENPYPEQAPIAGWHVNTTEPVDAWAAFRLEGDDYPSVPHTVYTDRLPVCYAFPDKETFEAYYTPESEPEL